MLREIKNPKQYPEEGFRRWFTDEYFDLIVWYRGDKKTVTGFQLTYDKERNERALTWKSSGSYTHMGVDDGEIYGGYKMSPVLVSDGTFNKKIIAEEFKKAAVQIDQEVASFVYQRLQSYY